MQIYYSGTILIAHYLSSKLPWLNDVNRNPNEKKKNEAKISLDLIRLINANNKEKIRKVYYTFSFSSSYSLYLTIFIS